MTHWQPFSDSDCFYFIVDSKPDEVIQLNHPDTVFCTAFVSSASCIKGVKNADLPWLKQYKESESLEESIHIVRNLTWQILEGNFFDLYVWVLSSRFDAIDKNGMNFLEGVAKEVPSVTLDDQYLRHNRNRFALNKAKMLVWYNFCLCQMAVRLVDEVKKWNLTRGTMLIDRLGDSDKRIMEFMQMITFESSMFNLWRRCAEDYDEKPDRIGYEYASIADGDDNIVPVQNSMQFALVDWIVHATFAAKNGIQSRDPKFHAELIHFVETLGRLNCLNGILFPNNITWQ